MKQIMITGDRSGSGKTSITLALAALLSKDHQVQTFKVGMDYIDPSYLSAVTSRPCRNLDSYTLNKNQISEIFQHGCRSADIAIVEGVRGCRSADFATEAVLPISVSASAPSYNPRAPSTIAISALRHPCWKI